MSDRNETDNTDDADGAQLVPMDRYARLAGFPDGTRQLAFETWAWRAGRSVEKTYRMLSDELDPDELPTKRTIERWKRDDDWAGQATAIIVAGAPQTLQNYLADFFDGIEPVLEAMRESVSVDIRDKSISPGILAAKGQSANRQWELFMTLQAAGQTDLSAKTKRKPNEPVDDIQDASERARRLRDRITKGNRS